MKRCTILTLFCACFAITTLTCAAPIRLVIHGGAGTIKREKMTAEKEAAYRAKLEEALLAGYQVLNAGGPSVEAVRQTIRILEDSPLFNAGKGAVFTNDERNELDASIMDGKTLSAGAVAGITTIKNPIDAAYTVMTESPHVLMVAKGAELFLEKAGLETVDPAYFRTDFRLEQLERAKEKERILLDHDGQTSLSTDVIMHDSKYGTVGAVALDVEGNLAAGTSTGGLTNKRYGRVGDSPIIGAGTYADNRMVAVSATGSGEKFIRTATAFNIAAQVKYGGASLTGAATHALEEVKAIGGSGGVIVLDPDGNYAMVFTTAGMYRGTISSDGVPHIQIYGEGE